MTERVLVPGDPQAARSDDACREALDRAVPTAAVIGGWTGHALAASRGTGPALGRAIGQLQARAGNGAVAQLLSAHSPVRSAGPAAPHPSTTAVNDGAPGAARTEGIVAVQRAGPPTPGPSWTKIGPPKPASFSVSGTLREVATALEARKEAGATITNSDLARETYEPPEGEERITAARFTVFQTVELPVWTDKSAATANQQAEWDRFSVAIAAHEAGHVATDKKSYANAHAKIKGQTPGAGDTTWKNLDTKAKEDNDAFDVATKNGKSTGTGINANIDEVTKVP